MVPNSTLLVFCVTTFIFAVAVSGQRQAQCCEEYCYELDSERGQSAHFASKTAYQIVKGSEAGRQYLVPNCNPVKIWLLSRHGTRLPSAKSIGRLNQLEYLRDEIVSNYEKRHSKPDVGALCEGDLDLLKRWRWNRNVTEDFANFLTVQGWNDLKFLAIHYQRIFPNIMENIYDQSKFQFRYTNTQRTEASYKAFVEGLFGENAHQHINVPAPLPNDPLLRPYENCPAWKQQNTKLDGSERAKFENSQVFVQLVNDVSLRLGYKFPLKIEQINDIFDMCRYDQAWNLDVHSAWCAAFTPNQINVLEYREDLEYYYQVGHGNELNQNIECAAVSDLLQHMTSNDLPKVVAYFSHASALQLFLTALGAAKDIQPLRADNYFTMSRRNWRTSQLAPFTGNLAAIKYECPQEVERNKIMFFLNEKPLEFSWCKVGLCNWSDVKDMYKKYAQGNCNEIFCGNSADSVKHSIIQMALPFLALVTLRYYFY